MRTVALGLVFVAAVGACKSVETPPAVRPSDSTAAVARGITPGARVSGDVTLTTDVSAYGAGPFCVTYLLGGRAMSGPVCTPPYAQAFHSAALWDGPETTQSIVRTVGGKVVGSSSMVPFTVANGVATLTSSIPDGPTPLRGTFAWTVEADRPFPAAEIDADRAAHRDVKKFEALLFAIDGVVAKLQFGLAKGTLDVDTTHLANGSHEFFVAAYSYQPGAPPVAMALRTVNVDNGRALLGVRPRWRDVMLSPGEHVALEPTSRFTDGTRGAPPDRVTFTSEQPNVARVDERGVVTAVAPGLTTITLKSIGEPATARIFVDVPRNVPHFGTDGGFLTAYDPARSQIITTMFFLDVGELEANPGLADQLHFAGVNALTTGLYLNPADATNMADLAAWKRAWEPWFEHKLSVARSGGVRLLLVGDDLARTDRELANSVQNPWAADAIRLAVTRARDSGIVDGIEMVDEASGLWGETPHPTNGAWLAKKPPLADDSITRLMGILDSVPHRPAVTWPILGIGTPAQAHNWMGDPSVSDYASEYWDIVEWKRVYPWGASLPQVVAALDRAVVGRYPVLPHDRPQVLEVSVSDRSRPAETVDEIMYGAAMGMAGLRAYGYDWSEWKRERAAGGGQTGADPFEVGTDRWWAMGSAFTLLERLEPWLLQQPKSALDLGPGFVTAGRSGAAGTLFMAINSSEVAQTASVDLSSYASGTSVTEIHIAGATTDTRSRGLGAASTLEPETVTFAPGETIVWIFATGPTLAPAPVTIVTPLPDAEVARGLLVTLDLGARRAETHVQLLVDGKLVRTLRDDTTNVTLDVSALRPVVWHCLAAQVVGPNGAVLGEARTSFRVPAVIAAVP